MGSNKAAGNVRDHEVFSASSAYRWAGYPDEPGCPASAVLASRLPPEPSSPAADEGTRAHAVLEDMLKGGADWQLKLVASATPDEMQAGIRYALGYVDKLRRLYPALQIYSEVKIIYSEGLGGKFDILCYDPHTYQMWVIDFKYGKVPVHPDNNPQLLCYAVFARKEFKCKTFIYNLVVIQPRDYNLEAGASPIKEWPCPQTAVDAWEQQIIRAVEEGTQDEPVFRPRPDRCRRCRAVTMCGAIAPKLPELPVELVKPKAPRKKPGQPKEEAPPPFVQTKALGAIPAVVVKPKDLSLSVREKIAEALDGLPAIEAYAAAVISLTDELIIQQNVDIPRYKAVYNDPRIAWAAEPKTIANTLWTLARISPADVMPPELISITRAKELLTAAIAKMAFPEEEARDRIAKIWEEFATLTQRLPSGKKCVVPVTDKRPAAALIDLDGELTASAQYLGVDGAEEVGEKS